MLKTVCYTLLINILISYIALKRGIIHKSALGKDINKVTQELAEEVQNYNTDSKTYAMTKADIYKESIHALTVDQGINQYAIEKIFAFKEMLAKI
jgi:CII-binding regulator of phage lambda lysogenization HflD